MRNSSFLGIRRVAWDRKSKALIARCLIWASTLPARQKLKKGKAVSVLVDTNVIRNGVTHTGAWIDTGGAMWGGQIPINTGCSVRIPKPDRAKSAEVNYLAGIAHLSRSGHLDLCTSRQLQNEQWRHPIRATTGDRFGVSVFSDVTFRWLDAPMPYHSTMLLSEIFPTKARQIEQLKRLQDPSWQDLLKVVGEHHVLDAFHLWTAIRNDIDYFLTMESKFKNHIRTLESQSKLIGMKTQIASPSEFAEVIGLLPLDFRVVGFVDSPVPVYLP